MTVKYINSKNEVLEFIGADILPRSGYLHQRKWNTSKENNVITIDKGDCTYTITLTLKGSLEHRKKMLNKISDIFEYDCIVQVPGTLYYDDYKIKCYVISSNTSVSSVQTRTNVELGIYCPKQQWIKEKIYNLVMYSDSKENTSIKKYSYSYPYVYSSLKGAVQIVNDSLADSDFIIRIYGPCGNPFIKIGEMLYQVNTALSAGEYMEINSQENTILAFSNYGKKRNLFNFRDKSRSDFFTRIPAGFSVATWNGAFKAEIVIFDKRGEPRWI